jgi:sulfite reductase alpha subunit-like flavoprotein
MLFRLSMFQNSETREKGEMSVEREIIVLYGSQTGTAQDLAERIGREALRYFMSKHKHKLSLSCHS